LKTGGQRGGGGISSYEEFENVHHLLIFSDVVGDMSIMILVIQIFTKQELICFLKKDFFFFVLEMFFFETLFYFSTPFLILNFFLEEKKSYP
jgi:hypothetical protein